jgi:hypothetical protein
MKERLKDLIVKNYEAKKKAQSNQFLYKNRKEVEINKNGSGYTIKEGANKKRYLVISKLRAKTYEDRYQVGL